MDAEKPANPEVAVEAPKPRAPSLVEIVRRAPVSALIILVNVVVFALAERSGSTEKTATLIQFGANWRGLVWAGQHWRLVTSMFLHIGALHLLWNGYYGFRLSAEVEREIGAWRFLVLYLLAGVAGSAASVIGHQAVSAGASGALFGLIGWQVMALRARLGSFRALWDDPKARSGLKWIGLWFIVGVFAGFDNYAHGGGLAFGLLFGWALLAPAPSRRRRLAVALGLFGVLVALSWRPLPVIHAADRALYKAVRTQDAATIVALTEPLLGSDRRIEALEVRSYALVSLGRYQDALDATGEVIQKRPSSVLALTARGAARFMVGDRAGAEEDFQRAIALDKTPYARRVHDSFRGQAQPH
jgi:rhomboid protease GluP